MKYIIGILISVSASSGFCEKLIVSRTNHQGYTLIDILETNKNEYIVSGFNVGKTLSPNAKALWMQTFESVRKMRDRKVASLCDAGQFRITLEDTGKKPRVLRGCYEDKRYRQVILNIKNLRKEAQTKMGQAY